MKGARGKNVKLKQEVTKYPSNQGKDFENVLKNPIKSDELTKL